jgi:hypothetical protein
MFCLIVYLKCSNLEIYLCFIFVLHISADKRVGCNSGDGIYTFIFTVSCLTRGKKKDFLLAFYTKENKTASSELYL